MATDTFFTRLKLKIRALLPQPQEPDENEVVTIATFMPFMRPHVDLLQSALEAQGIPCIVNGQWHTQPDFVRLQVRRVDAARANAIIAEIEKP